MNHHFQLSIPRVCTIVILAYSLIVMIGWIFGIDNLTRVLPNEINMKFATAFAFFLSGIALWQIDAAAQDKRETAQVVLPATTSLTLLIMATLLAAGIFGIQTGIEDVFVHDPGSSKTVVPGLPAIPTMINFILFGIASMLALFEFKALKSFLYLVGVIIATSGYIAVIGYMLHIPVLYYKFVGSSTPIAINTALLFIFLGGGLLTIQPDHRNV